MIAEISHILNGRTVGMIRILRNTRKSCADIRALKAENVFFSHCEDFDQ